MAKNGKRAGGRLSARARLTVKKILSWADAHHGRTGRWPTRSTDAVVDAPGERWRSIDLALIKGHYGLPGGTTLARLLFKHRGYRYKGDGKTLTITSILRWADDHRRRTGRWPTRRSGEIPGEPGERWSGISRALKVGVRGLRGESSLARLLEQKRGRRNIADRPQLSIERILAWADAHHNRTGNWPTLRSGEIPGARGETWSAVASALVYGIRGLEGRSSLPRLLEKRRGHPNSARRPRLTVRGILAWADAHRAREGKWPTCQSGALVDAPDERWSNLDKALRVGRRGLPGGSSIAQLLDEKRRISRNERRKSVWA